MNNTKRIFLWSGPRNISTTLMYSFAQRKDIRVFDEPLYAHYLTCTNAKEYHPDAELIIRSMECNGQLVVDEMLKNNSAEVLFFKNMTHHLLDLDKSFMKNGLNIILTRNPEDMLPSFHKVIPNPTLNDVGLGYIRLGQQATTLSGGEAQRIKLASELSKRDTGNTIYILDEPTTGLHFEDIRILMGVLNKLVDKGNTVLIIEHNLDVIKTVDHIIDIGPEGGYGGGEIVAKGTPEEIVKNKLSHTARFLKKELT